MIVQISNGTVYFGANDVFENIDFTVNENERIALVGRNGSGKTTLLKVLTGECELSSGQLIKTNKTSISYLKQNALALSEDTIGEVFDQVFAKLKDLEKQMEELSDAMKEDPDEKLINKYSALQEEYKYLGGYTYQSEMLSVLAGFGFKESDLERKVSSFSGGEKTKIAFASLLWQNRICCCWTSRPTTWTYRRLNGWRIIWPNTRRRWSSFPMTACFWIKR